MKTEVKARNFEIYLEPKAVLRIQGFLDVADDFEWMALLIQDKTKENGVYIKDIYLPPQTVGKASCKLDVEKFGDEMPILLKKNEEVITDCCGIVHSHGDINSDNFSSGDETEMHDKMLKYTNTNMFVSLLVDKQFKIKAKILLKLKFGNFEVEGVPVVFNFFSEEIFKECQKAWKKQIQEEIWTNEQMRFRKYGGDWFDDYHYEKRPKEIYTKEGKDVIEMLKEKSCFNTHGFRSKKDVKKWFKRMKRESLNPFDIQRRADLIVVISQAIINYNTIPDVDYDFLCRLKGGEEIEEDEMTRLEDKYIYQSYLYGV